MTVFSTSSTNGYWELIGENNTEIAGAQLGSNFDASLPFTGPYYLELQGSSGVSTAINYSIQITDETTYPQSTSSSGFDTAESGTLANGATTSYTFTAPAGLPVYFNSLGFSEPIGVTFTSPTGATILNGYQPYYYGNTGPYFLPSTGTYTLKLDNTSGASGTYDFNFLSLPSAATSLALGPTQTISGTLSDGLSTAVYSFLGAAGERVFVDNELAVGGPGDLVLYKPDGTTEFSVSSYDDSGPLSLTENGTYYLLVVGTTSASLSYQFRLTDTAYAPVTFGTTTDGTVTDSAQSDVYSFTGTANEKVYFEELSNLGDEYYDASWYLYGPNNAEITGDYYFGEDFTATLPINGNYTLIVYNNGYVSSGTYSFEAFQNVNPTSALTLGTEVSGTLTNPGDEASYTFTGTAGQRLYYNGLASASPDIFADLTDPYGNSFFENSSSDNEGPITLSYSGTYTLTILSYSTYRGTGAYAFTLYDTSTAPTIALTSGSGTTESGTLATGVSVNLYQFSGTAGQSLYFESLKDSPSYSSYVYLYDPANGLIYDYYTDYDDTWKLPYTGTYVLAIAGLSSSNSSVSYSFEIFNNVNPTSALTLGTTVSGTITNPGDAATYTFTGTAGQRIYYDGLASGSPYIFAELTDPYGNIFFEDSSSYDEGPYTLTSSGTYTLTILSYSTYRGTGAYAFTLYDTSTAPTIALTSGSGTTESGTLATGLSTNLYQFSGTAGQSLYFEGVSDSPSYGAYARVYEPNNSYLTAFYLEQDSHVTLPYTGTYIVAVGGQSASNSSVSYTFEVYDNVNPTSALTLGTTVTGTITNPGDSATYTFTGTAGQRLYYDGLASAGYYLFAELTNPFGTNLFDYSSSDDEGPYTLTYSGTYTLTIYSAGDRATGSYGFTLYDTSTAPSITLTPGSGTTESGTLATGLSTNLYQFSGTAGQSLYFDGISDSPADGAYATVYNPANGYLTAFYLEGDSRVTLPSTGTYIVAVAGQSASNSSVSYSFEVFDNVNTTSSLTLDTVVSFTLANPGDEATYTFTGTTGETLYYNALGAANSYLEVTLTDPYGTTRFNSWAYQNDGPVTLLNSGTYTLTFYPYSDYNVTGSYSFDLENAASATNIALTAGSGTTKSGTLATGLSVNLYQFTATAGERIFFQGQLDSPASGAIGYIYAPNNAYQTYFYLDSGYNTNLKVSTAGTYLLAVVGQSASNSSVSYQFEAFDNLNPTSALTLGTAVSGTLTNPGDEATYTFTGSSGENVFFNGVSGSANIYAELYNPSGSAIFDVAADSNAGPYTLSEPGTYSLVVYGYNGAKGSYDVQLLNTAAQSLTPTSTPTTVSGTITPGTGANIYQIAGTAGEEITLTSESFSSTDGTWYLVNPNNDDVASASFGSSFSQPVTLALTGPYELILAGSGTTLSSITYSFDISATTPGTVTPSGFGTVESGTLAAGASTSFTFDASAGLSIYFNNLTRSSQPITATFTSPNNNTVFSYSPYYNAGPYVLTATGAYTLKLTNTSSSSSGTYDFNMLDLGTATALTLGTAVSGTLNPGYTTVAYSFTGTAGQHLFLDNQTTTSNSVNLLVIDPYNNTIVDISASSDGGPLTLTASGTYYVLVDGESSSSVTYQFRMIDTSTVPLSFGTTTTGTVTIATQADPYSFTGSAGEKVYLEAITDLGGEYYSESWYLYGPNNAYITSGYFGDDFTTTLPTNGYYTLIVYNNGYYASGTYSFEAFQNVNPTAALTLGTEVSGTITNPGDAATYTFTGTVGENVYYDGLASGSPYIYAELTDPYGDVVFYPNSSSTDEGPFTLTYSGTYTLTISSYSTYRGTGAYAFTLYNTSSATSITLTSGSGTTETGTLATGLSTNLYQFSGTAGQSLYFETLKDSPSYGSYVYLYDPANVLIYDSYTDYDETWKLPYTGTYVLAIAGLSSSNSSVSYSFEIFDNVNPTSTLTLGSVVTGTITNPGDAATYTFTGTADEQIYYDGLASASYYLFAELTNPSGTALFNNSSSYDEGPYTLLYPGTYTLTIYSYGTDRGTGSYGFTLYDTSTAPTIALTPGSGTTESGTLATGLSTNLYQFSGTAGQSLFFESIKDSPAYGSYVYLYNPGDGLVTEFYTDYNESITLPYTGTYLMAIAGLSASNSSVSYSFELFDTVNTTSTLTLGSTVTGTITNPGDSATYTFTGTAGQRIYYNGLASAGYYLFAELTNPFGTALFDNSSSYDEGPYTLAYSGTYTLTIYSYSNELTTGSYGFTLYNTSTATTVTPGTAVSGTLATPLSANLYQFTTTGSESVYFNGTGDSPAYSSIAYFYNPANQYVNDFYLEESGVVDLPYAGTYILAVAGNGNASSTVSYSFEIFANVNPTTVLTLGTPVTASLTNPGDEHTYTFTGSPGETVYFDGLGSASGYIYANLTDPYGDYVFDGANLNDDYGPYTLKFAGTYSLTVLGSGTVGAYAFNLDNTAAATTIPLTAGSGTTESGTLATGLTTNLYQFTGTAGELVYFQGLSDSPANGAIAYFYSPSGSYVTDLYVENDTQLTLPFTGTYLLAVEGENGNNTSVSYSFELFANVAPSSPLTFNTPVSGTLTNPGDEAIYTFTGTIGQQVQFNGLVAGSYQIAYLYDPEHNLVFDSYLQNTTDSYTLTTPGQYELVITTDGTNTGGYDFAFLNLQSETKLQVNTTEADLTVTLSAAASEQVLVQYSTSDGTATVADANYKPFTGLLLFAPGQTTATAEVQALDTPITSSLYFDVNLSNPVGATIASGEGTGVVTINPSAVAPTVSGISPTSGPAAGDTLVTITGTSFIGATAVDFGTVAATNVIVVSSTEITADSPAGSGTVNVTVTTPGGTSATSSVDEYTYIAAPTVTGLNPDSGPAAGDTSVTITGTNFTGATAVDFGTNPATDVAVVSGTEITADSPAGSGTVNVTVTTPGGTSATSSVDQFTYIAAPTVTGINPDSGPGAGGTLVTITGTSFTGATAVDFGTTAATNVIVVSATTITADSPAGTGVVNVTVTTPGGKSATSTADLFTYVVAPTVSGVSPDEGPTAGGTLVTITGTNLTGATAVDFGTVAATNVTVVDGSEITADSPAGTGTVDVTVTTPGGTSATSSADQFTYFALPTVSGISPTSGPAAGDTVVTISGTNFTGAMAVDFGTIAATGVSVVSNTEITAFSPAGTGTVNVTVTTPGGTSATSSVDEFTYIPAPTVSGLNPTSGPGAGGTLVTITGTNLTGATAVDFGTVAATNVTVVSASTITADSPGGNGVVNVTVITPGGTSAISSADEFTYIVAPAVTGVSPDSGPAAGDTLVTITGSNFTGATAVDFGTNPATNVTVVDASEITADSPAGTGVVNVTVTTPGGTSATSTSDEFTYISAPSVTGVSPDQGPTAGDTLVTITGTLFSGATAVDFGTNAATNVTVVSATEITADSPAGTGVVDVTVTTPGGTSATSSADEFTYYALPTVTGVSPNQGPTAGDTFVTITGTNFTSATAVDFGTTAATSVTVESATEITADSPAGTGVVDVTVTTPGGTSATSPADHFTYYALPTVTGVSPDSGSDAGGTFVTITGTNFTGATVVDFGTSPATNITVVSGTSITADSPAGSGVVDVTVTTPGGTSATSTADEFTYVAAPSVTSISPTEGPAAGDTLVTITGTLFTGATAVDFGTNPATNVTVVSATEITADSPAGTGVVNVTVTTPAGTSATSTADEFSYYALPAVTGVNPNEGPTAGDTLVTITGTNFTGTTAVDFGTNPATNVTVVSAAEITADSPAGTGVVDVTVTTPGGTSATSPADEFTYVAAPSVTAISPTDGPAAGGTLVTITGALFSGATAVDFGTNPATNVTVVSATEITADSPAGTGVVNVTVTTPAGTSATSTADEFSYYALPAVTGVNPNEGPTAGDTFVTITGTNFTGATVVDFGTSPATNITVVSGTSITADSPAGTGVVDVTVTTPGGTSATSSADEFTYVVAPAVTGVNPNEGPTAGGTLVTITGTNFTGATAVDFGTTAATNVTVVSAAEITADSPAGTGVVDVTVTTPGGKSATSSADEFTYVVAPAVTGVNPNEGPTAGGTLVTITGTNFTGATAVDFGTTAATNVTVVSAAEITADSPAGTGVVDVTVTTPGGTSATSSADRFTYVALPAVTGVNPPDGPTVGGTLVTITGTNFTGTTAVDFGTTPATNVTVVSASEITADSPAGTGVVDVTVTTPGGTSATSPADQFTYLVALSPTAVEANGQWGFTSRGVWKTNSGGFDGTYLTTAAATSATYAQWRLAVTAGTYNVWVTWVASSSDATNAPYRVSDGSTVLGTVEVNQQQAPFEGVYGGVDWVDLGTFTINSGSAYVRLSANANGNLSANGVMLVASDPANVVFSGGGSRTEGSTSLIGPASTPTLARLAGKTTKASTAVSVPVTLASRRELSRKRVLTADSRDPNRARDGELQSLMSDSSLVQKSRIGSLEDILGEVALDVITAGKRRK